MEPFIVLVFTTLILRAAGLAGVAALSNWRNALRGGLSAMFLLTGVSHFVGMRAELIDMVPPLVPEPGLVITISGVLELAGAAGLLWSRTAPWAAGALTVLLVAIFPANVYAALAGVTSSGAVELLPRTLMQVVYVLATSVVAAPMVQRVWRARHDSGRRAVLVSTYRR